jgi:hypothetical protein
MAPPADPRTGAAGWELAKAVICGHLSANCDPAQSARAEVRSLQGPSTFEEVAAMVLAFLGKLIKKVKGAVGKVVRRTVAQRPTVRAA